MYLKLDFFKTLEQMSIIKGQVCINSNSYYLANAQYIIYTIYNRLVL